MMDFLRVVQTTILFCVRSAPEKLGGRRHQNLPAQNLPAGTGIFPVKKSRIADVARTQTHITVLNLPAGTGIDPVNKS